jgi:hypothetical protein
MRIQFKEWMTPAAVGVISFAAGVGAGYFFKKYRDETKRPVTFNDVLQDIAVLESSFDQLQMMYEERDRRYDVHMQQAMHVITALQDAKKEFLEGVVSGISGTGSVVVTSSAVQNHPATIGHNRNEFNKKAEKVKLVVQEAPEDEPENVYSVTEDEDWDWEEEVKNRTPERPYILHRDEFFSNESEFRQTSLTYYNGDNILCDENDVPIYNPEKIVGVLTFGHGSADPSIVYIRNDRLMAEYEVILEPGYYQTEVLGHEVEADLNKDELRHFVQRFRASD